MTLRAIREIVFEIKKLTDTDREVLIFKDICYFTTP